MIRKLLAVIITTLALNFLALAGGVGWLYQQGSLTREKITQIRQILLPDKIEPPPATTSSPGTSSRLACP